LFHLSKTDIKHTTLNNWKGGISMERKIDKRMSAQEAIAEFVHDDDVLIIGNYTLGMACGLVYEVVRQKKKKLTHCSQSGHLIDEVLVAGGCVERLVTAYVVSVGGNEGGSAVGRAWKKGELQLEEYTNFNYNARLLAGMHGFSFMTVFEGILHTDLFEKRGFMGENKYKVISCPFTGKDTVLVPALNPDVCVIHVQRADKYGNSQYWGAMGSVQTAALASKRIIVSCEELVEHDVVRTSPNFTIIPAFRVSAVVEMPWGAHPSDVVGHYNKDKLSYAIFLQALRTEAETRAWMDEWVYGCRDHNDYMKHCIDRFGLEAMNRIKARAFYSTPANYGAAFTSAWDENERERTMGVTLAEMEQFMKDKGVLYE
jgi:glutaconate CoA-transferase subunit A